MTIMLTNLSSTHWFWEDFDSFALTMTLTNWNTPSLTDLHCHSKTHCLWQTDTDRQTNRMSLQDTLSLTDSHALQCYCHLVRKACWSPAWPWREGMVDITLGHDNKQQRNSHCVCDSFDIYSIALLGIENWQDYTLSQFVEWSCLGSHSATKCFNHSCALLMNWWQREIYLLF